MLRRFSLIECVSVLHGNRCLQSVEFFFLRWYVQPCLLKNPKYTFYAIKSSLKLAYNVEFKYYPYVYAYTHAIWSCRHNLQGDILYKLISIYFADELLFKRNNTM